MSEHKGEYSREDAKEVLRLLYDTVSACDEFLINMQKKDPEFYGISLLLDPMHQITWRLEEVWDEQELDRRIKIMKEGLKPMEQLGVDVIDIAAKRLDDEEEEIERQHHYQLPKGWPLSYV